MATFEAQVEGLTSLSIDGSSAPTQTELTQFLTDGAKEILTTLPDSKKELFTTSNELNGSSVNYTVAGSEVFSVTRDDGTINQPCRRVPARLQGRVRDSGDMMAASQTDPVYYIANNLLSVVPEPSNSRNAHVQALAYPAVAYGDSAVAKFPDEAEYLIPLYASIKSLQNAMAAKAGNSAITTALTAMQAAIEAAESIFDKMEGADNESVFGDEETFLTANSQLTRVKDAVDKVSDIVNGNQPSATTDAFGAQANEDIELVTSALNIAQTELSRAQVHLSEWTAIGDMRVKEVNAALAEADGQVKVIQAHISQASAKRAESQSRLSAGNAYLQEAQSYVSQGNAYIAEAQAYVSQAQGYASEVSARAGFSSAKTQAIQGHISTAQAYVSTAQGFGNEVQSKTSIAQAYGAEIQSRLAVDSAHYSWYEKQQAKLQADYEGGIQKLLSGYKE